MSIEKGLFILLLFLIVVIFKYFCLKKDFLAQRNYFIQTLSHDFRVSIIAQIRGLELIQKERKLLASHAEMIDNINESCKFTLDMINMIINTYKFEDKKSVLNYEFCNLSNIISNSCNIVGKLCLEKNIKIINSSINNYLDIDKSYMFKVINILLSTAIFYSKKNSSIKVTSKNNKNNVEVNIIYEGDMLTEEERKRMFLKNPRFSTVGHGIKMYLCKKIIDFHKGQIYVNQYKNNLVSFSFKIPTNIRNKDIVDFGINRQNFCSQLND